MRKAIYTVLIGEYEQLLPAPKFAGWDAICFTDNTNRFSNGWELRELPVNRDLGAVRTSRLPRILPYKYLPEYEESIYADASIIFKESPDTWGLNDALWASARHWERANVWQEFMANTVAKKTHQETNAKQEADYKKRGLENKHIPLFQNCVIYRKHNNPEVIKTCEAWWNEFVDGTCRDQLSLPMALAETGLPVTEILPRPKCATNNTRWKIIHNGKHREYYQGMPLSFLIYNLRGSAIARGIQIGKCLFDRGTRNHVYNPSAIPAIKNSTVVVVKELREKDLIQLKRQRNKIIYDIVDNQPIWDRGLGACAKYIDGIIFPSKEMIYEWINKGYEFPKANTVIHHHGDTRFEPNNATEFKPVCISTGAQIPQEVFDCGVDCITEAHAWEGLFSDAKKYNLHIAVYNDTNTKHKPPSKLVTAAACNANIILQRLPSNLDLLPEEYPYYINDASEIEGMLELCKRDYGGNRWNMALEMVADVQRKTTGNSIAAEYERFISEVEKPEPKEPIKPIVNISDYKKDLKIFFHVGMIGQWRGVLDEQMKDLIDSGILDHADLLLCSVGDDRDFSNMLRKYAQSIHINSNIRSYEFPTLQVMWDAAQKTETGKSLYIHTKGASRNSRRAIRGAIWRRYMMDACVKRWRECISYLDKGYDLVGADWKPNCEPTHSGCAAGKLNGFFAGNFYWANNEYLQTLPRPEISCNRINAESWIGTSPIKPSVFEMAHIGIADDPTVLDRTINK